MSDYEQALALLREALQELKDYDKYAYAGRFKPMSRNDPEFDNRVAALLSRAQARQQEPVAWIVHIRDEEPALTFVNPNSHEGAYADEEITALYTAPQPAIPDGWQLVPKEPTRDMLMAGETCEDGTTEDPWSWMFNEYKAMLAAAPKPEGT